MSTAGRLVIAESRDTHGAPDAAAPEPNRRVLVIDDNRAIHEDFRKVLAPDTAADEALAASEAALFGGAAGRAPPVRFEIESAYQGLEAVALAQQAAAAQRPFALAFVDVRMPPGIDGPETTKRLWAVDPDLQVVICTAYSDYAWADMFSTLSRTDQVVLLKKPFDGAEALQLAHALTEKWNLARESRRTLRELEHRVEARTRDLRQANHELGALVEKHRIAAAVIDSAAEGVMVTDARLQIESVNPAFERITGYPAAQAVGRTPNILSSGRHDDRFFRELRERLDAQGHWGGEIWNRRRNGTVYPQETSINALRDGEGCVRHYASVFSDSTARHELEARLRELSSLDGLSGVTNRRVFDQVLASEWARALREQAPLSLLIADIDHFKKYNDRHGHQAGDRCLRAVAQAMQGAANRAGDVVARYGGEEFAAILPRTDAAAAVAVAERIRQAVAALALPHGASDTAACVSLSVGIASAVPAAPAQQGELIGAADRALYAAKRAGRNRVASDESAGRPVTAAPSAAPPDPAVRRPMAAANAIRILQLEDSAEDAALALRQLRKDGLECDARRVDTREGFVATLEEFRPDVILADYNVPGFSGAAALALARQESLDVPVIVVSGVLADEQAVTMIKAGARDFVLKDRLGRLGSAVRGVLEHKAERRRHADAAHLMRDSETWFRTIFERAPVACAVTDAAGVILEVNGTFAAQLGVPSAQLAGTSLADLAHPDDRAVVLELIGAAGPGPGAAAATRWRCRDGRTGRGLLTVATAEIGGQPVRVSQLLCSAADHDDV